MIIEAILELIAGLLEALTDFISNMLPNAPAVWTQAVQGLSTVIGSVPGPIKNFLPLAPAFVGITAVLGIVLTLGAVRFARRALSLFTGGGGQA